MHDRFQKFHFAELLRGDIFLHSFWTSPTPLENQNEIDAPNGKVTLNSILCPYWRFVGMKLVLPDGERKKCLLEGTTDNALVGCSLYIDSVKHDKLPCLAVPWLEQLDCSKTVMEHHVW